MKPRIFKLSYIIFFSLSSILFFIPDFISLSLLYSTYYAILLVTILLAILSYRSSGNNVFDIPIFLLLIAILISGFSATYSWGQGFLDSFKMLTFYLSYILFFLLVIWKTPVKDIEKIIIILGIIYIVVYSVAFLFYPTPIFGGIQQYTNDRGFQRIFVSGFGFLFLFSFYTWSQYLKKKQFFWLILFLITVIYNIMLLTRTLIIVSFIILVLYMFRMNNLFKKVICVLFLGCFISFVTQMNFFKLLVEQTQIETENVQDNIRVLSVHYYLNDFSPNTFARIFGNGEASGESDYFQYKEYLEKEQGLFQSDIGYVGLYSKFGLLSVLAYLILIYRTFKISIPIEYLYCKYFLYFIFIISLIICAPFSTSYIPSICFALYILSSKNKSKMIHKS